MRGSGYWTASISVSLSLLLLTVLPIFNEVSGERNGEVLGPVYAEPEIDIQITPGRYQANVQPGQDGLVTILGNVLCDMPPYTPSGVYCVVHIFVDAGGWFTSEPPDLVFSRATVSRDFTITLLVPMESTPDSSRDVRISGMWEYSPGTQGGTTETESVYVEVLPYVFLLFRTERYNSTIEIGETGTYVIEIENRGTCDASVSLMSSADSEIMETRMDRDHLDIPAKQIMAVELSFEQPSGPEGDHTVTLAAQDVEHGGQDAILYTFKVTTKEKGSIFSSVPYLTPIIIALLVALLSIGSVILVIKLRERRMSIA
ncbi:MAG: hypothetical protein JXA22_06300 [Candidatus Thermoplasmatota archaeon]|nr:hypothetical protein [Candidatus Thermoplasmatota archaeon]